MSQPAILAAIKAKLLLVDGITIVHDYERYCKDMTTFLNLFKTDDNLFHGWMISRSAMTSEQSSRTQTRRTHRYKILGIYALDDSAASEKIFQAIIESIINAFDADADLGGICAGAAPMRAETIDNRIFGNVLCHYAELYLDVPESATYTRYR